MAAPAKDQETVAVVTLRTVREGEQERFEAALHEFIAASLDTEGQLGVHVIRPAAGTGSREYGIVRRFACAEARDRFYASELFRHWEETVAPMVEGAPERQELTGLEAWFSLPPRGNRSPPRWKMALATLLGVYPVSVVVPWLLQPLIQSLHPMLQAFCIASGIVATLTWVVMPVLVRPLEPWLYPREERKT